MSRKRRFGEIALSNRMISRAQLEKGLELQEDEEPEKILGQILLEQSYLSTVQIDLVIQIQNQVRKPATRSGLAIGQKEFMDLVIEQGFCSKSQVRQALEIVQGSSQGDSHSSLTEVMIRKRFLTHGQLEIIRKLKSGGEFPRIEGYKLLSKLAQGGMGYIYKARQLSMDRIVALKVLDPRLSRSETHVQRFVREAQTAARLNHENIVGGIDVGSSMNNHYFVMEYVNGESVLDMIKREEALPVSMALSISRQTAEALDYASRHSIIHRDVKPSNILINHRGRAKICDLGFAKVAENEPHMKIEGLTLGTPFYMSPEQAMGSRDLDTRTDIYALGASLYHMVMGVVPFSGKSALEVMKQHVHEEMTFQGPRSVGLDPQIVDIIRKMMAKKRENRFQTHGEVIQAIDGVIGNRAGEGQAGSPRCLVVATTISGGTVEEAKEVACGIRGAGGTVRVIRAEEVAASHLERIEGLVIASPVACGESLDTLQAFFGKCETWETDLRGIVGMVVVSNESAGADPVELENTLMRSLLGLGVALVHEGSTENPESCRIEQGRGFVRLFRSRKGG